MKDLDRLFEKTTAIRHKQERREERKSEHYKRQLENERKNLKNEAAVAGSFHENETYAVGRQVTVETLKPRNKEIERAKSAKKRAPAPQAPPGKLAHTVSQTPKNR